MAIERLPQSTQTIYSDLLDDRASELRTALGTLPPSGRAARILRREIARLP